MALQADDLVLLADGRVLHHGGTADAATHRAIVQVFDGRVEVHAVAGRWVALPREREVP
jgi:iron complex transport system ATP-binding protein